MKIVDADDVPTPVDSPSQDSSDDSGEVAAINGGTASESPAKNENTFQPPADFEEYVAKYGDTLSGIAQKFLGCRDSPAPFGLLLLLFRLSMLLSVFTTFLLSLDRIRIIQPLSRILLSKATNSKSAVSRENRNRMEIVKTTYEM
jgi:hypothetical protein